MRQSNKEKISITVDYEVYEYIKNVAEQEDRSVSQQINKVLKDFIKKDKGE